MASPTTTDNQETTTGAIITKTRRSVTALLLTLLSTVVFAVASQFMVFSTKAGVPKLQLIFLTKLVEFLSALVLMPCFRPKLAAKDKTQALILSLSTITDNLGTILAYVSFVYVSPGIAVGITQGSIPFVTACIGFLFLKETVGVVECLGIFVSAAGVIIVAIGMSLEDGNASCTAEQLAVSILLPLATAFTKGPNNVAARSLVGVQGMSVVTLVFYVNLVGTVALFALTYIFETPIWTMSARIVGYVIGLCLCDLTAAFSLKVLLKLEKAGIAATLLTLVLPLTVLLDYLCQSKFPNDIQLGGVFLVLLGTLVVGGHTWWVHRQKLRCNKLMERLNFHG